MGFKDLAMFNDALLAKQAWRVMHTINSIFSRVFKSKFFPDCSILEALMTSKGSYAWQSILQGREVLKKGARWCVGNGDDISIWGDVWLPSLDNPRIAIPLGINFPEIRVRSPHQAIHTKLGFRIAASSFQYKGSQNDKVHSTW